MLIMHRSQHQIYFKIIDRPPKAPSPTPFPHAGVSDLSCSTNLRVTDGTAVLKIMAAESRIARLASHVHNPLEAPPAASAAPSSDHAPLQDARTGAPVAPARCAAASANIQSYVLRHWDQVVPYVGHESALIWPIFRGVDGNADGGWANTVMNGMTGWTIHRVQGRRDGDYHAHPTEEQLYYFLTPAKMLIDGSTISVVAGDLLHVPPRVKHQLLNAHSQDWVEHLLVTAPVSAAMLGELAAAPEFFKEQLLRNYRDASPTVVALANAGALSLNSLCPPLILVHVCVS